MSRFSREDHLLRTPHGVDWYVKFDDDQVHIGAEQDLTPLIERNKALQNISEKFEGMGGDMRYAATIPVVIQQKWLIEHGIDAHNPDHWDGVKRLLNSNEYRYLRPFEWKI